MLEKPALKLGNPDYVRHSLANGGKPRQRWARVEEWAWQEMENTGDLSALRHVRWAIEHRAKVFGHYAPSRHKVESHDEVRIAGMRPEDVAAKILARLSKGVAERRKRQRMLGERN